MSHTKVKRAFKMATHLLLLRCESRDQPSLGPAVALRPPLLNSDSGASSRLKDVDWLLLILGKRMKSLF